MISRTSARMFVATCLSAAALTGSGSTGAKAGDRVVSSFEVFEPRAVRGDAYAQFMLGWSYFDGDGAPRDHVIAYKWFAISSQRGFEPAEKALNDVEQRMNADQLEEAKRLVKAWKPVE